MAPSWAKVGPHINNINEKRNIRVLSFMLKASKNLVFNNLFIHFVKRTAVSIYGSSVYLPTSYTGLLLFRKDYTSLYKLRIDFNNINAKASQ